MATLSVCNRTYRIVLFANAFVLVAFGFTNIVVALSCMYKQLYIPGILHSVHVSGTVGRRHGSGPRRAPIAEARAGERQTCLRNT